MEETLACFEPFDASLFIDNSDNNIWASYDRRVYFVVSLIGRNTNGASNDITGL